MGLTSSVEEKKETKQKSCTPKSVVDKQDLQQTSIHQENSESVIIQNIPDKESKDFCDTAKENKKNDKIELIYKKEDKVNEASSNLPCTATSVVPCSLPCNGNESISSKLENDIDVVRKVPLVTTEKTILEGDVDEVTSCLSVPAEFKKVEIVWNKGGNFVEISGSFNDWKECIALSKINEKSFSKVLLLKKGSYAFKFIVDTVWMYDDEMEKEEDGFGGFNNICVVY